MFSAFNFVSCHAVPTISKMIFVPHNFSRVSARDARAFGSGRPGFPSKSVPSSDVSAWIAFMRSKGINRVLSLLGDDEVSDYYPGLDLDEMMSAAFGQGNYMRTSVFAENSYDDICRAIASALESGDAIVMHCSGGEGRAAIAMTLWLVNVYGLAPEDAAREIDAQAEISEGVVRRTDASKVAHLIRTGSMRGFS